MRYAFALFTSALALAAVRADIFPDIDVDKVMSDEKTYKLYFDCLKGGECTPEGKAFKDVLPDALATQCSKCSKADKEGAHKIIKFLLEQKPDDYDVLEKIYDPKGITRSKFQKQ